MRHVRRFFASTRRRAAFLFLIVVAVALFASDSTRAFYRVLAQGPDHVYRQAGTSITIEEGLNTNHYLSVIRGSNLRERGFLIAQYDGPADPSATGGQNDDATVELPLPLFDGDAMMVQGSSIVTTPTGLAGGEIETYIVESGDTLSTIGQKHGLKVETLAWANGLTTRSTLKVGQTLKVLPVDGVLHRVRPGETLGAIAYLYSADLTKVIDFNGLDDDGFIVDGQTLIIPGGKQPAALQRRVAAKAGSVGANIDVTGYFMRPTTGRQTQGLHAFNAVDLGSACGSPIYAAAPGQVVIADGSGWNGGYGKYVKIEHPNGTATLYAHLSKILTDLVNVERGDLIGLVGSTGRSTGCHVHFEVYNAANPFANYR